MRRCRGIIAQSGGHIAVESAPGKGATFVICLPCTDEEAETVAETPQAMVSARGTGTILLVEDEASILKVARRILERTGYQVLSAVHGEEALHVSKAHTGPIDLLMTDIVMPGMAGTALAKRIKATRPEMRILYTSRYTEDNVFRRDGPDPGEAFLPKPYSIEMLTRMARETLADSGNGD